MLLLLNTLLLTLTAGEECWWSGCQLDSWAEIGCFPSDEWHPVNSTPCVGGNFYQCCRNSDKSSKNTTFVTNTKTANPGCWWSGCQPYDWAQRGCFPEEEWEAIELGECDGGDMFHCCKKAVTVKNSTKLKPKPKIKEVTAECWWSGCQPSDWGDRGCFPSEEWLQMNSTKCDIGDMYFCCRKYVEKQNNTNGGKLESSNSDSKDVDMNLQEFQKAVIDCGYDAPNKVQYKALITQATSRGAISSKRELAMFLAQILWESGGLKYKKEIACQETGCPGAYDDSVGVPGKSYYGRGYIQLTHSYNYKAASQDLYHDDRLVKDPDLVSDNENIAWATAFWYWKRNVHNKPGVQKGLFGASTMAINGKLECDGVFKDRAKRRFELYEKVLNAFQILEQPIENGCYD